MNVIVPLESDTVPFTAPPTEVTTGVPSKLSFATTLVVTDWSSLVVAGGVNKTFSPQAGSSGVTQ